MPAAGPESEDAVDTGDTGSSELVVEQRGPVRWLRLDRPQRRNALTVDLVRRLGDAVLDAGADPDVRAIALTGAPPVFCAGGDLADLGAVADRGALAVSEVVYGQFHRLVNALADVRVPVVAAVNGAALGAGLDLAMACDLRVAATTAVFASSWISVGLVPGMGGAHLLSRAVGATRASEMVLLGRQVAATEALDWGLVNEVVEADALELRVDAIGAQLASLSAPAVSRSKGSLRRALADGFTAELAVLGATQGSLLTSQEFRDATARFRR
jgi:2-(1,2-epoxy-1,2-dihydrophenyl)acetyl-CoA isomerase